MTEREEERELAESLQALGEVSTEMLQAELRRREVEPLVEYARSIRYSGPLVERLFQSREWTDGMGVTHQIASMDYVHACNVLRWLWNRREHLKLQVEFDMTFRSVPVSGEAAQDAFDDAHRELLEQDVDAWFDDLPLVKALRARRQ